MSNDRHFRQLESMYQAAPINAFYEPTMTVCEGEATIEIALSDKMHHSAGAVHGSVYFKMLDDAAFFAANSLETEVFVLTASFTTYLTRPVVSGKLIATGKVVNISKSQFIVDAIVSDGEGNEVGRGNGIFAKSRIPLNDAAGYPIAE